MKPLLTALLLSTVSAYAGDFVSLFDGKTLTGWHAPDGKAPGAGWVFDQGTLHLNGTPGGMLLSDKNTASSSSNGTGKSKRAATMA
jgi:hypothetical protein